MSYLTPYTIPPHWKGMIEKFPERNGRTYVKTAIPGKPKALSIPLWLILKKVWVNRFEDYPTSKKIKSLRSEVKINGKLPKDERALVMMFDHLTIGNQQYRFELFKNSSKGRVDYRLVEDEVAQKMIVSEDRFMGKRRLTFLNGQRMNVQEDLSIPLGSIWTKKGIISPGQIKKIVRLTGKNKYVFTPVSRVEIGENQIELEVEIEGGKTEKVILDRESIKKKNIAILA